tara:strand:+ start:1608 stop:1889 length:282 start_codon:yes stop_codon:yes gene_type:complete
MKYWLVVKFTGFDGSQRQGDIKIWSDYSNSGHVYDSPAYEIVARCKTFKEAQAIARHEGEHKKLRIAWQLPSEVPASNKAKIVADWKKRKEMV